MIIELDRRQAKRKKLIRFYFMLFLLTGGFFLFRRLIPSAPGSLISPVPDDPLSGHDRVSKVSAANKDPAVLEKLVKAEIGTAWNNYSVVVSELDGPFKMAIGDTVIYTAASVNKIPILTALYNGFANGTIDPDRVITLQKQDIQDYGTGSMRYAPVGTQYSLRTLARLMIEQSDNTAAYILSNDVLGVDKIQKLIDGWGLSQTDMVNNKTSNSDQLILFQKIYTEKIAGRALTKEMLGYLADTDFNDRLPALLPQDVPVYHKIGSEVGNIHDVGIVGLPGRPYYIGIFVSDVPDEDATVKKIAAISKLVYDFMKE